MTRFVVGAFASGGGLRQLSMSALAFGVGLGRVAGWLLFLVLSSPFGVRQAAGRAVTENGGRKEK